MKSVTRIRFLAFTFALALGLAGAPALKGQDATASPSVVPPIIKFNGVITSETTQNRTSDSVSAGLVTATFSLYQFQEGGSPLWSESQKVQLDEQGRYVVLLGATSSAGLPLDLFTSGKALWLGVQPQLSGAGELPRVLLVAVPYALKATDADTLGGMPASAFMLSQSANDVSSPPATGAILGLTSSQAAQASTKTATTTSVAGSGMANFIPLWTNTATLGDSLLFQTGGLVGLGTMTPGAKLDSLSTGISLRGTSSGPKGTGVYGSATSTTGLNYGIYGETASKVGAGVFGKAISKAGANFGVSGQTASPTGAGVLGNATSPSGLAFGVVGWTFSSTKNAAGVNGIARASSGNTIGVWGHSASAFGTGVLGEGSEYGVKGTAETTSPKRSASWVWQQRSLGCMQFTAFRAAHPATRLAAPASPAMPAP